VLCGVGIGRERYSRTFDVYGMQTKVKRAAAHRTQVQVGFKSVMNGAVGVIFVTLDSVAVVFARKRRWITACAGMMG
jgi:hypothetical protein